MQIACTIAAQALVDLNFGLIAPFFPGVCAERGVSHSMVGAIFTVHSVAALSATPFVPFLCGRFGNRLVMLSALTLEGALSLGWAGVGGLHDTTSFLAASLVLRVCSGAGQGLFEGSSTAMLLNRARVRVIIVR